MTPYATLQYFEWAILLLIPGIGLRWLFRRRMWPLLLLSLAFLTLIFWNKPAEVYFLSAYTVWQGLLIWGFSKLRTKGSPWYYGTVILSVLPLFWVKLVPVLHVHTLAGFLGVSYLTFKCVQMTIEIRDGQIKAFRVIDYLAFLLFFPTLSAGPIDRYRRFEKELQQINVHEFRELMVLGLDRLFRGFLYKFIIAYEIQNYWMAQPLVKTHSLLGTLDYMYAYSFYLFFDFAGYSAFAIGFSYLIGIRTPENFNKPFISRNIKDFWNRWHMTLSFWFRDYVYMRLVMLLTRKKVINSKRLISYLGYLALFGLMGFWHGFALQYIVYGFYHALLMMGYDSFERFHKARKFGWNGPIATVLSIFITFHVVCFGFLIFSGRLFS